jgi:hypothetical protein
MAWKWQGHLTPYGEVLQDAAFENINVRHYSINITEQEIMWECRVTRNGQGNNKRNCFFLKEPNGGSVAAKFKYTAYSKLAAGKKLNMGIFEYTYVYSNIHGHFVARYQI